MCHPQPRHQEPEGADHVPTGGLERTYNLPGAHLNNLPGIKGMICMAIYPKLSEQSARSNLHNVPVRIWMESEGSYEILFRAQTGYSSRGCSVSRGRNVQSAHGYTKVSISQTSETKKPFKCYWNTLWDVPRLYFVWNNMLGVKNKCKLGWWQNLSWKVMVISCIAHFYGGPWIGKPKDNWGPGSSKISLENSANDLRNGNSILGLVLI